MGNCFVVSHFFIIFVSSNKTKENMEKVRIKFSADLIIEGENMEEVREKWENMPLFSKEAEECGVEYSETLLIEDADTYQDLTDVFNY